MLPECRKYYSISVCEFSSLSTPQKGNVGTWQRTVKKVLPGVMYPWLAMLLTPIFSVLSFLEASFTWGQHFPYFYVKKR